MYKLSLVPNLTADLVISFLNPFILKFYDFFKARRDIAVSHMTNSTYKNTAF